MTNEFEGFPGIPALEWMTLEERDGRTYLTAVSLASSVEVRDMVVSTGMEGGARETYDRLDEVIAGLSKAGLTRRPRRAPCTDL